MAHEVGSFIDHEAATLHPDGVAAAEVRVKVCAVIAALIAPTLEVFVLVKDNLVDDKRTKLHKLFWELCLMFQKKKKKKKAKAFSPVFNIKTNIAIWKAL